jgi:hypothetical protein
MGLLLGMLTHIRYELPSQFAEQLDSRFVLNVTSAEVRDHVARLELRNFSVETTHVWAPSVVTDRHVTAG